MPRLLRITAGEATRAVLKAGFTFSRSNGSQILHPKVIRNIINDTGLTVEEFITLL